MGQVHLVRERPPFHQRCLQHLVAYVGYRALIHVYLFQLSGVLKGSLNDVGEGFGAQVSKFIAI